MDVKYVYTKTRADFGKQCIFDNANAIEDNMKPNPALMKDYILKNVSHTGSQNTRQFAVHEAQTARVTTKNTGMFHFEGGWPKEINPRDEDATLRFRRRAEKDDEWAPKLRPLLTTMEHYVLQNGAVNIHEHYFDDMIPTELVRPRNIRTAKIYTNPQRPGRPVSDISWAIDSSDKMVVSYCDLAFGKKTDTGNMAYIWQIDNPNEPYMALEAHCPPVVTGFNPRDPSVLASGLMSGQVCSWDVRVRNSPVLVSNAKYSHRYPTIGLRWIYSKSNTEFFSSSSDGCAMWWDTRHMREPTESLVFDLQNPNEPKMEDTIGVSSMNFEPAVGTKFMFGLENGIVISGSRKAKSAQEKLALRFSAQYGPVASVDRNPFNPKIFLTVGDWKAKVWAEDTREGALITTPTLESALTGGCWNRQRFSIFYIITRDGTLRTWDIMEGLAVPILMNRLCDQRLTTIAPHDEGALVAVGNADGKVYLAEPSQSLLMFDKNERVALSAYLERCSRFAKAIDSRIKEVKLAKAAADAAALAAEEEDNKEKRRRSKHSRKSVDDKKKGQEAEKPGKGGHRDGSKDKRKSGRGDKKKLRDEYPELAEAEDRYFEILAKEREKYEQDEDEALRLPREFVATGKKHDAKKGEKKDKKADEKDEGKGKGKGKKAKPRPGKSKKEADVVESLEPEETPPVTPPVQTETAEETVEVEQRRRSSSVSKKSRQRITGPRRGIKLPRPCKVTICKPKICCRIIPPKPEKPSVSIVEEPPPEEAKAKMDKVKVDEYIRRESRGRHSETVESVRRFSRTEKLQILHDMIAPPTDLARDVKKARQEIREASIRISRIVKRTPARVLMKTLKKKRSRRHSLTLQPPSATQVSEEAELEHSSAHLSGSEIESVSEPEVPKEIRPRRLTKKIVSTGPLMPTGIVKEIDRLVEIARARNVGDETSDVVIIDEGALHFKEVDAASRRVYPRISEFHPTGRHDVDKD